MRTSDFDYELPPELVAQHPSPVRDQSRLLIVHRNTGRLEHRRFSELPEVLREGDLLVLNDSRVIRARLWARKEASGGKVEVFLVQEVARGEWWVLARPAKRLRSGSGLELLDRHGSPTGIRAVVDERQTEGHCRLSFDRDIWEFLEQLGDTPLPPYIHRPPAAHDPHRYQTVYARHSGSVAAPTAGLHFTESLLQRLQAHGVELCPVTLHVGYGTFAPVQTEEIAQHRLHSEAYSLSPEAASQLNRARNEGRRIVAVGTTSVRLLESAARAHDGSLIPGAGHTDCFIYPPYDFRVVGGLVTNFHLPRSSLLMLVSAFAAPGGDQGRELVLRAYRTAIEKRYRFYSYGDAMLIV